MEDMNEKDTNKLYISLYVESNYCTCEYKYNKREKDKKYTYISINSSASLKI